MNMGGIIETHRVEVRYLNSRRVPRLTESNSSPNKRSSFAGPYQ